MNTPHIGRSTSAIALSLVAIIALGALQAGAEVSKKAIRPSAIDITIAELSQFQLFTPTLPGDLPAHIEFSMPIDGVATSIVLDKTSIRGDNFKVLVDSGNGVLNEVDPPAVRTYKGTLAGRPQTIVVGSLLPTGFSATIHLEDATTWVVQPLSDFRPELARNGQHVSFSAADVIPDGRGCALGRPGFPISKYRSPLSQAIADGQVENQEGGIAGTTPRQVEIGCETDHEFYVKNGSNVASTINDIELIVSNVNVIYDRDLNITHELGTIVVALMSTIRIHQRPLTVDLHNLDPSGTPHQKTEFSVTSLICFQATTSLAEQSESHISALSATVRITGSTVWSRVASQRR